MKSRTLIIAAIVTAAATAPALADWNIVKSVPETTNGGSCMVVERDAAATGETRVGGPFATEAEAKAAVDTTEACRNKEDDDKSGEQNGSGNGGTNGGNTPN
jgi:hypothetical protein